MVAGENAEAAGIIRDRFVETKLGGEIGDRLFDRAAVAGFSVSVFLREIIPKGVVHFLQLAEKIFVLRYFDKPSLAGKLKHPHRVVVRAIPKFGIEMAKETAGRRLPGP